MGATPILFGPAYSVYVRSTRIALAEKGVAYRREPFDIFDDEAIPPAYLERHPFKRVPAFEHDGFALYETGPILRYIDEAFPGPPLQPSDPRQRARMNQAIAILDAYVYWPLVRVVYVQRVRQEEPDEAAIADALSQGARSLSALEALIAGETFFSGPDFGLADGHAAPMFDYFMQAAEVRDLMAERPALGRWWQETRDRPSVVATRVAPGEL